MKGTVIYSILSSDSELSRGCGGVGIASKKHLQASPVSGYNYISLRHIYIKTEKTF